MQYTTFKNTLQQIAQKIGDIEQEAEEHKCVAPRSADRHLTVDILTDPETRLVLETLDPLPGDRKCFRMINGVLVERTVQDVIPALKTNAEGLGKVLEDLVKQYKTRQDELEKWKVSLHGEFLAALPARPPLRSKRILLTPTLQKKNKVQVVQS